MTRKVDVAIIGGGAAGLAAASAARDAGAGDVLIMEREGATGGILKQCIHNGFGLARFDRELTGPEYAALEAAAARERGVEIMLETTVLSLSRNRHIIAVSPTSGVMDIDAGAVVLAMGSRERTRGALRIPGTRPAGIYTAGAAQHMVNLEGIIPGREIVMLGSGDIGLIMARRLTFEGAHVKMVLNRSNISSGLRRNIVQCLDDFGIPLRLSHTVTSICGHERLRAVGVSQVDPKTKAAIPGTEELVECDTLLLSVGLLPENELTRDAGIPLARDTSGAIVDESLQTCVPGIFSAGNVLHIHDLVDQVSAEAEVAGRSAAAFAAHLASASAAGAADEPARMDPAARTDQADEPARGSADGMTRVESGSGVSGAVPQRISSAASGRIRFTFRPRGVYRDATVRVLVDGVEVKHARKRILLPAEMADVTVDAADIVGHGRVEIVVEAGDGR